MSGVLAISGGEKTIKNQDSDIFDWPLVTKEIEDEVLKVLRAGKMSGTDITEKFEKEFAQWQGTEYALACNNGTAALHSAMWACGIGKGTEIIAPTMSYWATFLPALNLGATVNFADIDPETFNINVADIEHRINENTRAIVIVHFAAYPADMDPIMEIAQRHKLKVIEDVSHAQGALYKGRKVGTLGDAAAMSLMTGKSFAIGEGGMLVTNDNSIFQRAAAFGHYERTGQSNYSDADKIITDPELIQFAGVPMGGFKYRMHQLSSAMGRVQLRNYDSQIKEISKAMNYFWDIVSGTPGIIEHRPPRDSGTTMGGWYAARAGYDPDKLDGLPVEKFCKAVRAEGSMSVPGTNAAFHLHPVFHSADIYGEGKATMLANSNRDVRQGKGTLKVAEGISQRAFTIPWFKHFRKNEIEEHAEAFMKVAENYKELL